MAYSHDTQRGIGVTHIVDSSEIYSDDDIRGQILTIQSVLYFPTNLDCFKWCARRKLLKNSFICENCGIFMSFCRLTRNIVDGYHWTCKICKMQRSIRKASFFERSKLHVHTILTLMYGWALEYPQDLISYEARLGSGSTHTVVDWYNFCRDVCEGNLMEHAIQIGGLNEDGTSKTVEIDIHQKYHRGKLIDGHWVFGGIERESKKCFLVEVPDTTEETLSGVIERHILPGTIIVSDGWRAYSNIRNINGGVYEHQAITHEENFVDPEDRAVHTQNVENMWMCAKRKLRRQFGTSEALFHSYLHDFVWRNQYTKVQVFPQFLIAINSQFPVS